MSNPLQVEVVLSCGEPMPVVDAWVVVDILRATTVMTTWFSEGGKELYPADSIEAAASLAKRLKEEGRSPLLMGERDAVAPSGFDLGNSPLDITRELTGKHDCAVMATTNGTRAILSAASTGVPVLIACARNASAALELAVSKGKRIGIFCSGRKERPCWDDVLCAGFLLSRLVERFSEARFSDGAKLAHAAWRSADNFEASLRGADHALDLEKLGFGADIAFAAKVDAVRAVPEVSEFFEAKGTGPQIRAILRAAALA